MHKNQGNPTFQSPILDVEEERRRTRKVTMKEVTFRTTAHTETC